MNEKGLNTFNRKPAANFFKELSVKRHLFQKKQKKKIIKLRHLTFKISYRKKKKSKINQILPGVSFIIIFAKLCISLYECPEKCLREKKKHLENCPWEINLKLS